MSFHQMELTASIQDTHRFLCGSTRSFERHDQAKRRDARHAFAGRTLLCVSAATEDPVGQMEIREAINIDISKLRGFENRVRHSQPLSCDYDDHQITSAGTSGNYFEAFQKNLLRTASCAISKHSTFSTCGQPGVAG